MIKGFSASITVTLKLHDDLLNASSVAKKVFVVIPTGKLAPLERLELDFEMAGEDVQLSVAVTVKFTTALH